MDRFRTVNLSSECKLWEGNLSKYQSKAADALFIVGLDRDMTRDRVRDILTAAIPHIEKEIRTQIAAEMKRRDNDYLKFANRFGGYYMGLQSAFHEAAQIAEGANND